MHTKLKIVLYGQENECKKAISMLENLNRSFDYSVLFTNTTDKLQQLLATRKTNLVIVIADGADGMEAVYTAKEYEPDITVFWFSDDIGFAMQSHRLECAYFSVKPLTEEKLSKAFYNCKYIGLQI